VQPGVKATLYDVNDSPGSDRLVLTSDEPNLANRGFNDKASEIWIQLI